MLFQNIVRSEEMIPRLRSFLYLLYHFVSLFELSSNYLECSFGNRVRGVHGWRDWSHNRHLRLLILVTGILLKQNRCFPNPFGVDVKESRKKLQWRVIWIKFNYLSQQNSVPDASQVWEHLQIDTSVSCPHFNSFEGKSKYIYVPNILFQICCHSASIDKFPLPLVDQIQNFWIKIKIGWKNFIRYLTH